MTKKVLYQAGDDDMVEGLPDPYPPIPERSKLKPRAAIIGAGTQRSHHPMFEFVCMAYFQLSVPFRLCYLPLVSTGDLKHVKWEMK